jgi:hypothetical protein
MFDDIPEDREESFECEKCGGNITKHNEIWACDNCLCDKKQTLDYRQEAQDWKDRYEQRMIAFEDMEADRNWLKGRIEFEKQHKGRDLSRHRLRGTYQKPAIAALWNQHLKTISWIEDKL